MKIIWDQLENTHSDLPELHVTATDLNPKNLDRAQKGVYQTSSFKEMPEDLRDRFFEKGPTRKSWTVKSHLKDKIIWNDFNLLSSKPPPKAYDIIFLRNNILLYAAKELKLAGFKNVVSALADSGILIVGTKDTLPKEITGFKNVGLAYVFQRSTGKLIPQLAL